MIYAPVLLITLNRFDLFKKCIESLQRNTCASHTELYIGMDYPSKEDHVVGNERIKEYISNGITGFLAVHVICQKKNVGWYKNFEAIQEEAYKYHDRIIYSEDDNVFSPNFLEYMDKCLDKFENDKKVQAICGYSYPFEWKAKKNNILMVNTYFPAWGYGIWKLKDIEMNQEIGMRHFEQITKNVNLMTRLFFASRNQFCNIVKGMVEYIPVLVKNNEIVKLDMAFSLYTFSEGKVVVFPAISKVRNMGNSEGGMNCAPIMVDNTMQESSRNFDYCTQLIDENETFNIQFCPKDNSIKQNNILLNIFYKVENIECFRSVLAYLTYLIIGRKKAAEIIKKRSKKNSEESSREIPQVILRNCTIIDLDNLRMWKNRNKKSFFYQGNINSVQQKKWFCEYEERQDDIMFIVEEKILDGNSLPIGCMGFRLLDSGNIDLYNIIRGRESTGTASMKDAMCLMLNFILYNFPNCPIKCDVLKDNPSVSWYHRCGFEIIEEKEYYIMSISTDKIKRYEIDSI